MTAGCGRERRVGFTVAFIFMLFVSAEAFINAAAAQQPVPPRGGPPGAPPAQPAPPPPARMATVPQAAVPQRPLSPEESAALDRLLAAWETRNASVKTWSCNFVKWEFDTFSVIDAKGRPIATKEHDGELKYAAPDKGLFRVKVSKQWNPQRGKYEPIAGEAGEHWVCNGTSIYQFKHAERQLVETRLPPEMRGKAISDGPLPFVFGAKAETLKARYSMRISTPQGIRDRIWLEAAPRWQGDAVNFSKVTLMLQARDLMPLAIEIHKPGGQDREVYQFDQQTSLLDRGLDLIRDFSRPVTPLGYTFILEDQPPAPAPAAVPGR